MDLRAEGFGASGPAVRSVPIGPACEAGEAGGEIVVQGTHEDVGFTPDHPRTHPGPAPDHVSGFSLWHRAARVAEFLQSSEAG